MLNSEYVQRVLYVIVSLRSLRVWNAQGRDYRISHLYQDFFVKNNYNETWQDCAKKGSENVVGYGHVDVFVKAVGAVPL
jgi:hypothetical protein